MTYQLDFILKRGIFHKNIWLMLRMLLLSTLLILFIQNLSGQRPNASPKSMEIREVVSGDDNHFYTFSTNHPEKPDKGEIAMFNYKKENLATKEITFERSPLTAQFEAVFFWDNHLNVLSSLYYPGPKRNHLLLYQYDANDLSEVSSDIISEAYTPALYRVPFGYGISPDRKFLALYSWTYTLPKDPARLSIKVFTSGMKPVWSGEYQLPIINEGLFLYDCKINDKGELYMLAENYLGKPGPQIDERKIQYLALAFKKDLKEPLAYFLNNPLDKLTGVKWDLAENGTLLGAAFFTEKGKVLPAGYLTYQVPSPGAEPKTDRFYLSETAYQATYPFSQPEPRDNPNRRRFDQFVFRQISKDSVGNLLLEAEQNIFDPINGSLEFNDILIIRHDNQDKPVWMRRIPKRQQGYSYIPKVTYGYKSFKYKDQLFFLFNDAIRNQKGTGNNPERELYEGGNEAVPILVLDTNGKLNRFDATTLLKNTGIGAIIPDKIWQVRPNYLLAGCIPLTTEEPNIRLIGLDLEAVLKKMQAL